MFGAQSLSGKSQPNNAAKERLTAQCLALAACGIAHVEATGHSLYATANQNPKANFAYCCWAYMGQGYARLCDGTPPVELKLIQERAAARVGGCAV